MGCRYWICVPSELSPDPSARGKLNPFAETIVASNDLDGIKTIAISGVASRTSANALENLVCKWWLCSAWRIQLTNWTIAKPKDKTADNTAK